MIADFAGYIGVFGLISAFIIGALILVICLIFIKNRNKHIITFIESLTIFESAGLIIAVIMLAILLQMDAFEYIVVFDAVETGMPWFYKLGGLWSGQANSLLFWSTIMSIAAVYVNKTIGKMGSADWTPAAAGLFQLILIFFIVPIVFFNNPFEKLWTIPGVGFLEAILPPKDGALVIPIDGLGMNPSLRHPAMLLHPPFLYLGLIGFFVPYVLGLTTLLHKDEKFLWIKLAFPVTLAAWLCLTIGMFLGSWWAYTILGWGGYWGWDAVEISGLLPWILSFGLVHSMRMEIRGHSYRKWVYVFSISIVILIVFGILLTRSGLIESVHAYSSGTMGPMLTVLLVINLVISLFLFMRRRKWLNQLQKVMTRSYLDVLVVLLNINILLLAAIFLFGQTLPVTSRLFSNSPVAFSPEQYETFSAPLLISLLIIMGLYALSPLKTRNDKSYNRTLIITMIVAFVATVVVLFQWQVNLLVFLGCWASIWLLVVWLYAFFMSVLKKMNIHPGLSAKHTHHIPSALIHLGFAVMALGIMGVENFASQAEIRMGVLDSAIVNGFSINTHAIRQIERPTNQTDYGLELTINEKGNRYPLNPIIEYFPKREMLHALPMQHSNIIRDIQVVMTSLPEPPDNLVTLRFYIFPLMPWIWTGGAIMGIGGVLGLSKEKKNHA